MAGVRRLAAVADRGPEQGKWARKQALTQGALPALTRRSYLCSDLEGDGPATIGIGTKVLGHAATWHSLG